MVEKNAEILTICPSFGLESFSQDSLFISEQRLEFPLVITAGERQEIEQGIIPTVIHSYLLKTSYQALMVLKRREPRLKFNGQIRLKVQSDQTAIQVLNSSVVLPEDSNSPSKSA